MKRTEEDLFNVDEQLEIIKKKFEFVNTKKYN